MQVYPFKNIRLLVFLLIFTVISFCYIFKLDYPGMFTDEILYIDAGREHFNGAYTESMQVPLFPKYAAGFMYLISNRSVALMRTPYALLGILTSYVIFLILKKEFGFKWGLLGAVFYSTSNIIYSSTRLIMLEPLLHLAWALFHYYYYAALTVNSWKYYFLSGLFLGLSLISKINSIILLPFTLVFIPYLIHSKRLSVKKTFANYSLMYFSSVAVVLISYIDAFVKIGEKTTLLRVINGVKETYFAKSIEGKNHVLNNVVYTKSPWWAYAYFIYAREGVVHIILYITGAVSALIFRNFFIYYWLIFLVFTAGFYQLSGVKNERYVSSMLLPLIPLVVAGYQHLLNKNSNVNRLIGGTIIVLLSSLLFTSINQKKTEYNAIFDNYLKQETNNYTSADKIYIYGSIRSARWYKHGKGNAMFEISKNFNKQCPKLNSFTHFVFDDREIKRYGSNLFLDYISSNNKLFEVKNIYGFTIYERLLNLPSPVLACP